MAPGSQWDGYEVDAIISSFTKNISCAKLVFAVILARLGGYK